MKELWKDVPGYEGLYKVSNVGNVSSLYSGRLLRKRISTNGYYVVDLTKDHSKSTHRVHRLVALAFIPAVDGKPIINHIDGDRLNNSISNLEWCTQSENVSHAYDIGLNRNKLVLDESEILNLYKTLSMADIAKIYNVSITAISSRLRKNGIDTHARKSRYGIELPTLLEEIKSGARVCDLSKKYGCSSDLISQQKYKFKKEGIL